MANYDWIWFPDDDLIFSAFDRDRFIDIGTGCAKSPCYSLPSAVQIPRGVCCQPSCREGDLTILLAPALPLHNRREGAARFAVMQPSLCPGSVLNHDVFLQNPEEKHSITPVRSVDLQACSCAAK